MFNLKKGKLVAKIKGGKYNNKILYIKDSGDKDKNEVELTDNGVFVPLPDPFERQVIYVAGPSGSGKSTYACEYIKSFLTIYPDSKFFIFSRTDCEDDPAFDGMNPLQIKIDEDLLTNPIDITKEIPPESIILFDDVNTIQNTAIKKAVDSIMADIMEVGRKLKLWIVITNHLIIPNERKIARTILNESQLLTVFPKSGSSQQIRYALKTYFGYDNKQINEFMKINSRWLTFSKTYPQYILAEKEAIIPQ